MRHRSVLIIAHRGASAVAPESTRAAILEAIQARSHMIELDVQMTQDERLVVFHDERLERTTDAVGRLANVRYSQIAHLDAGAWFDDRLRGEQILLLSQALKLIPGRVGVNLELKTTKNYIAMLHRLALLLKRQRAQAHRQVLLSSFDSKLINYALLAGYNRALICRNDPELSLRKAMHIGCSAWHPAYELVTPRLVAEAHSIGLRVNAWTVDKVEIARRLIRWGIDGLFTNNPARLRHLISSRNRHDNV